MSVKIIDLSVPLVNKSFEPWPPVIHFFDHREGAREASRAMGVRPDDFPDGLGAAMEEIHAITHTGTHLDAPWHFGPTSEGRPAKTIDQIPLQWCYGNGVVLDFRYKKRGEGIYVEDVKEALKKIPYIIVPYDIILIMTGTDKFIEDPQYPDLHPGMTEDATLWLIEQGVKVMGIDAYGWDRPFSILKKEFEQGTGKVWPAHILGRKKEYCHIEKLANLDKIPKPFGFKVAVFPINILKASAAWCRAVAIIEE
jgi:kynurenine formamidase